MGICETTASILQSCASSRFEGRNERRFITFRIALEDRDCLELCCSIFLLRDLIFENLFPRVLSDPTSTRLLLTELRRALLANEGTTPDFKRDTVSSSSLTTGNSTSRGRVKTEGTEGDFDVNPLSLSSSSEWDNWTVSVGLVAVAASTLTTKTEVGGNGVFQDSWLYMLAVVIAEIAVKATHPDKVYNAGDSSVELDVTLQKEKR